MPHAAVPRYLGTDFHDCPPGHRFTLYGTFWEPDAGWVRMKNVDPKALQSDFKAFPNQAVALRDALVTRQRAAADLQSATTLALEAVSVAPFVTGTGIEHPLENGMAFLDPYGLPYLPGSGVKGVIRRAAEELAGGEWGDSHGWNQAAIDTIFGEEPPHGDPDANRNRGAVSFWDVFPRCNALKVDIMNPHNGEYYQGKNQGRATPHDGESPIPIYFLTVPEKTGFCFHVQCELSRLPTDWAADKWRGLLEAAFAHAFDWLGFGAKTAVGYGAMATDLAKQEENRRGAEARAREKALASLSPATRMVEQFIAAGKARVEQLRGSKEKLNAEFHGRARQLAQEALEKPEWTAAEKHAAAAAIAEWLPQVVEKIDKDQLKKLKLSTLKSAT